MWHQFSWDCFNAIAPPLLGPIIFHYFSIRDAWLASFKRCMRLIDVKAPFNNAWHLLLWSEVCLFSLAHHIFLLCLAWLTILSLLACRRYLWVFRRWERSTSISQRKCHMASKWSLTMSLNFVAGSLRSVWCTRYCWAGLVFTGFGLMIEKVVLCFSFFPGLCCRLCFLFLMPCACVNCAPDTTTSLRSSSMTISSS